MSADLSGDHLRATRPPVTVDCQTCGAAVTVRVYLRDLDARSSGRALTHICEACESGHPVYERSAS